MLNVLHTNQFLVAISLPQIASFQSVKA